jgi:hypothetical protein
VIPCCLSVGCDSVDALNLFAEPGAPHVRLRRSIRFVQNQAKSAEGDVYAQTNVGTVWINATPGRPRVAKTPLQLAQHESKRRGGGQGSTGIDPFTSAAADGGEEETLPLSDEANGQEMGDRAVWRAPANYTQEVRVRRLYGEIHLPQELQPSCKFPLFNILVSSISWTMKAPTS